MKKTTVVRGAMVVVGLGLAALFPATCKAQAEVAPDFYESANTEAISQPQQLQAAAAEMKAPELQGKFTLAYTVQCPEAKLTPGEYAVSVDVNGIDRPITLRRNGEVTRINARAAVHVDTPSPSALLIEKTWRGRKLEGVYVDKLNLMLYVNSEGKEAFSGRTERVPIS
jgi:hypothetical protein